jgi:biopolymer transport protein ExbB/TolQ
MPQSFGTMPLVQNCATLSKKPLNSKCRSSNGFCRWLATIAFLAPLLGLLGTVAGMIDAFATIASSGGYATVTELSTGVYKSLLTAAAGLVVATPTFVLTVTSLPA